MFSPDCYLLLFLGQLAQFMCTYGIRFHAENSILNLNSLLQDAVDCPEWVVPFHVFKSLAEEV